MEKKRVYTASVNVIQVEEATHKLGARPIPAVHAIYDPKSLEMWGRFNNGAAVLETSNNALFWLVA